MLVSSWLLPLMSRDMEISPESILYTQIAIVPILYAGNPHQDSKRRSLLVTLHHGARWSLAGRTTVKIVESEGEYGQAEGAMKAIPRLNCSDQYLRTDLLQHLSSQPRLVDYRIPHRGCCQLPVKSQQRCATLFEWATYRAIIVCYV